jgi:hypothetical protein
MICVTALYGLVPLRALGQNWSLIFTSFLPALLIMILLSNAAEDRLDGIRLRAVPRSSRPAPCGLGLRIICG